MDDFHRRDRGAEAADADVVVTEVGGATTTMIKDSHTATNALDVSNDNDSNYNNCAFMDESNSTATAFSSFASSNNVNNNSNNIIQSISTATTTSAATTTTTDDTTIIKWSTILATPTLSHFTPSMECSTIPHSSSTATTSTTSSALSSLTNNELNNKSLPCNSSNNNSHNLHGLGLKYCVDKSTSLSRTCGGCASLLYDVASLHDELSLTLGKKIFPTIVSLLLSSSLSSSSSSSSLEQFASGIYNNLQSFADQIQSISGSLRTIIVKPYQEWSTIVSDESMKQYSEYNVSRVKCVLARKEAMRLRMRYVECVKEETTSVQSLRKAIRAAARGDGGGGGRKKKKTTKEVESIMVEGNSIDIEDAGTKDEAVGQAGMRGGTTTACTTSWMSTLRQLGNTYNVSKQCESLILAHDEMLMAQSNYTKAVTAENAAVEEAMAIEKMALDSVQHFEEERVIFVIGLVDRFLQDAKLSLENMFLGPPSTVDLLDVVVSNPREQPVPSQPAPAAAAAAMFMNPRRRAQSDEPAINETRQLNLPDNIAEIRDNMRCLIGRRFNRIKTMKLVASFNEDVSSAIDSFASNLTSKIERSPSFAKFINKTEEGANVVSVWNSAIGSLEIYARNAEILSKQMLKENEELQQIISLSEKGAKILQEREEIRWKSLCDAAKIESKARSKHKQYLLDLQKARARLTSVEEGSGGGGGGGDDNNVTPRKSTKKIDKHVNKAMGKMFSILPGGGEEVMNKVLTPQQRVAIATRQLDEAEGKEGKGTESFENARSVKEHAIVSYTTEAKAAEVKFISEERNEWKMVQTSLLGSVDAMRNFRDEQLKTVTSSILMQNNLQEKALKDVARWAVVTEKRVRDHLTRCCVEDEKDDDVQFDSGFRLKVQLMKYTDVQESIRYFLDDNEDVSDDMMCREDDAIADSPSKEIDSAAYDTSTPPLSDVPADTVIQKMDSIFSKTLTNVSIEEYYLSGWSEEETPLYGQWLKRKGSFDISVGDWELSTEKGFEHAWSGETFQLKRVVQFKFRRTTHLYIGPPIASVTQTQYLMKDGNDRCIVMMTVDIEGVPYSDSFAVEVRWAARRLKEKDLAIDAGVFVRFTKASMFASKIKSGTLKETSGLHLDLFEVIKSAITSTENGGAITNVDAEEPGQEVTKMSTEAEGVIDTDKVNTPLHYFEYILRQSIVAVSSLSQRQQLYLALFIMYLVTKLSFLGIRTESSSGETMDLVHRVEDLAKEVREIKAILKQIHDKLSEENSNRDEL